MKILAIYQSETMASSRIRIIQLAPYLELLGIDCVLCNTDRAKHLDMGDYDLIVIQKKLMSWAQSLRWHRVKCPILFDFDDAIFFRDKPKNGSFESKTRQRRFDRTMRFCAGVICGNTYLAEACPKNIPRIIASSPVPHEVAQKNYNATKNSAIIGWVGGGRNLHMLDLLADSLRELKQTHSFELHVLSDRDFVCEGIKVVNHHWALETQEDILATFDIGLMPMKDTPWSRGKCSYKLLQYMASGVIAVGSDVGMNREIIVHGETGYLVSDNGWVRVLSEILDNKGSMEQVGKAGRKIVLARYTYDIYAKLWEKFLRSFI